MNIGIIGGATPRNLGSAVAAMIANMIPESEVFKMSFNYDGQYVSKIYEVNSFRTRGDFVQLVADKGFDYLDQDAADFVNKGVVNIFKVERI